MKLGHLLIRHPIITTLVVMMGCLYICAGDMGVGEAVTYA